MTGIGYLHLFALSPSLSLPPCANTGKFHKEKRRCVFVLGPLGAQKANQQRHQPNFLSWLYMCAGACLFGILVSTSAIPSWTVLYERHESRPRILRWQMSLQSQHCFEETYTLLYFLLGSLSRNHKKPRNQSCTDASRSSLFLKGWPHFYPSL